MCGKLSLVVPKTLNNDFHMCGGFVGAPACFKQEHLFGNLDNSTSSKKQVGTWDVKKPYFSMLL